MLSSNVVSVTASKLEIVESTPAVTMIYILSRSCVTSFDFVVTD